MKIAQIASESNPFFKTGGLADVVYALSEELASFGHEVIVALPYYKSGNYGPSLPEYVGSYDVYLSWRVQEAKVYRLLKNGVSFYFIGNDYYFGRDRIYGYDDDGERFAFFALAARTLLKFLSFKADIVQCHDWQAAMIPCLVKEGVSYDPFYQGMRFVLTIHNPAFKGMIDRYFLNDFYNLDDGLYFSGKVRFEGMVSTLKSGIVYADKVTTVSPTHRAELLSDAQGQGLSNVLRLREGDFVGVLNGIDIEEWDPSSDRFIAAHYDAKSIGEGKKKCRENLLSSLHIQDHGGPVYGLVSRLSWQKGIDLVIDEFYRKLSEGASLVILGSGEYGLEQKCEALRSAFPDSCAIYIGYNGALSHKIYAGSDFFLMPSLFEPCGISQMISQRYGTLPIVRYTGGLVDTVHGYLPGEDVKEADGIGFNDYNDQGLGYGLYLSDRVYADKALFAKLRQNAMKKDHSWAKSARAYEAIFASLIR